MKLLNDLIEVKDERWAWPTYDLESYPVQISDTSLMSKIKPFLKKQRIAIQAGGNCGITVNQFAPEFETIYTFEPDPLNFYCLNLNVPYSHIIKFQACLGDRHTMIQLNNSFNTNIKDVGAVHINEHRINNGLVPMLTIDDLQLPYCDLIQLDIEGYEIYAILGGMNTIKQHKPTLCIEVNEHWMKRYNTYPDQLTNMLHNLGYTFKLEHMADRIYTCE